MSVNPNSTTSGALTGSSATTSALTQQVVHLQAQVDQNLELIGQLEAMIGEMEARSAHMEKELAATRLLQQSLLPAVATEAEAAAGRFAKVLFENSQWRISGIYIPCDALGGDLFDVVPFAHEDAQQLDLGITVADVSGHGLAAAFITAIYKATYHRMTHLHSDMHQLLAAMNDELVELIKTGAYLTALACRLTGDTLSFSSAGHPAPMWYRSSVGCVERPDNTGSPLGWFAGVSYDTTCVTLSPGDQILLFSDGVTEMKNAADDIYTEERLEGVMASLAQQFSKSGASDSSASGQSPYLLDLMLYALSDFTEGYPLQDDVSMLLIERL